MVHNQHVSMCCVLIQFGTISYRYPTSTLLGIETENLEKTIKSDQICLFLQTPHYKSHASNCYKRGAKVLKQQLDWEVGYHKCHTQKLGHFHSLSLQFSLPCLVSWQSQPSVIKVNFDGPVNGHSVGAGNIPCDHED